MEDTKTQSSLSFDDLPIMVGQIKKTIEEVKQLQVQLNSQINITPQDQLLNIQEAAGLLNLAVPTVYSLVNRREIPHMKRGKKLFFSKEELLSFIKSGRRKTRAEITERAGESIFKRKGGQL